MDSKSKILFLIERKNNKQENIIEKQNFIESIANDFCWGLVSVVLGAALISVQTSKLEKWQFHEIFQAFWQGKCKCTQCSAIKLVSKTPFTG